MHTLIRDAKTTKHDFVFYADRLIRLVSSVPVEIFTLSAVIFPGGHCPRSFCLVFIPCPNILTLDLGC